MSSIKDHMSFPPAISFLHFPWIRDPDHGEERKEMAGGSLRSVSFPFVFSLLSSVFFFTKENERGKKDEGHCLSFFSPSLVAFIFYLLYKSLKGRMEKRKQEAVKEATEGRKDGGPGRWRSTPELVVFHYQPTLEGVEKEAIGQGLRPSRSFGSDRPSLLSFLTSPRGVLFSLLHFVFLNQRLDEVR